MLYLLKKWSEVASNPITSLERPQGFQEVEIPIFQDSRHVKVVRLSALTSAGFTPQEIFLALISVRGWVNPRAIVQPEGFCQWKIPVTPSGIKPATFWLVVQCLNPCTTSCPHEAPRPNTYSASTLIKSVNDSEWKFMPDVCIMKLIFSVSYN